MPGTSPGSHAARASLREVTADPAARRPLSPGVTQLGRIGGVPVLLAPSWWLGALLITALYAPLVTRLLPQAGEATALLLAATLAVLLGVSVLLHELGHCLAARWLGLPVRRVRLFLLGGISELTRRPARPRDEGLVAAAGPAVSLLLAAAAGAVWLLLEPGTALWLVVVELAVANAAVAVFNLLPGLPLDGGRVLRALVWSVTGRRRAGTTAAVVGAGLVALGLLWWALLGLASGAVDGWLRLAVCVLMVWFVLTGASAEAGAEQRSDWLAEVRLDELVRPVLPLPAESPVADVVAASAGRGVVLVRSDGVAAGLLDLPAAERLAGRIPAAPAERAAEPIRPETVLLRTETGPDVLERVRTTPGWQFLVVDGEGRLCGVLHRDELRRALAAGRETV